MNERPPSPQATLSERRGTNQLTVLESFGVTFFFAALTLSVGAAVGVLLWWVGLQLDIDWAASRNFRINVGMAIGYPCLFASMAGRWEYVGFGVGMLILTIAPYYLADMISVPG